MRSLGRRSVRPCDPALPGEKRATLLLASSCTVAAEKKGWQVLHSHSGSALSRTAAGFQPPPGWSLAPLRSEEQPRRYLLRGLCVCQRLLPVDPARVWWQASPRRGLEKAARRKPDAKLPSKPPFIQNSSILDSLVWASHHWRAQLKVMTGSGVTRRPQTLPSVPHVRSFLLTPDSGIARVCKRRKGALSLIRSRKQVQLSRKHFLNHVKAREAPPLGVRSHSPRHPVTQGIFQC